MRSRFAAIAFCQSALLLGLSGGTASAQVFTRVGEIPQFGKPVSYLAPGVTEAVLADVNGDGILDLVTANGFAANQFLTGGHGVSVLLGKGDGTFEAARSALATGNPVSVVVGDFDNDGKADIAIAYGPGISTVSILHGNGDGTFQPPRDIAIGFLTTVAPADNRGASSLVAADFTGDGRLDLAVAFSTFVSFPNGSVMAVGRAAALVNRGDGTFSSIDIPTVGGPNLEATDFDGDGRQDLLSHGAAMATSLALGNGDGTFTAGQANIGPITAELVVGDFNGDGKLDVAGVYGGFTSGRGGGAPPPSMMSFGLRGGTFTPGFASNFTSSVVTISNNGNTRAVTFNGNKVAAADFNGDGNLDIAGFHFISYGTGDGQFNAFHNDVDLGAGMFFKAVAGEFTPPLEVMAGDLDGDGLPDLIGIGDGNHVQVALNLAGHAPKLALLGLLDNSIPGGQSAAHFVAGGATTVTGELWLGAPAPAGGAVIALSSSDPAAFFPAGNTVTLASGQQGADFLISTAEVGASTPVTISASYHAVTLTSPFTVVPPIAVASISISPESLFGMFGGNPAAGTVTLSGPASDGVVVSLVSANPAVMTVPASVSVSPGATTATFPLSALPVGADIQVSVSASFPGSTRSAAVTVLQERASVVMTKAQYTVSKSLLHLEATSTDAVSSLQVFNASTGALAGSIPSVGGGKYVGNLFAPGPFTSAAVQSGLGGLMIAPVPQR